jgi:hypothetical protein
LAAQVQADDGRHGRDGVLERLQGRKGTGQARGFDLVEQLWLSEVAHPVAPEGTKPDVAQVLGQDRHDMGRHDLAAVGSRADTRRLVDHHAEVITLVVLALASVDAHADPWFELRRPNRGQNRPLERARRPHRGRRPVEHQEVAVTLASFPHERAALRGGSGVSQLDQTGDDPTHPASRGRPHQRTALDVREQEGHGP